MLKATARALSDVVAPDERGEMGSHVTSDTSDAVGRSRGANQVLPSSENGTRLTYNHTKHKRPDCFSNVQLQTGFKTKNETE